MKDIFDLDCLLKSTHVKYRIWAPAYQEYIKFKNLCILVDRLIYSGYIFVGLENEDFDYLDSIVKNNSKGIILGTSRDYLTEEEAQTAYDVYLRYNEQPRMVADVKVGDYVTINMGPFSGQSGVVKRVRRDGRIMIRSFLLGRELDMDISVLDIQNLGATNANDPN